MDYVSEVVVYQNQRPSRGHRVRLSIGGFLSGGMTGDFYTDGDGVARVRHTSMGPVEVYVDGNMATKGRVPGRLYVYL